MRLFDNHHLPRHHVSMARTQKSDDWDEGTPDYKVHCTDGVLDKDDERNI